MRKLLISAIVALPLFAGALTLQVDDPRSSPEAITKNAMVLAHITACHSPEKTTVTAVAEGLVKGRRQTIPLKVVSMSQPGSFAIARQWPRQGTWTVKMTATNPDYPNYSNSLTIPLKPDTLD